MLQESASKPPLIWAIEAKELAVVERLLNAKCDINACLQQVSRDSRSCHQSMHVGCVAFQLTQSAVQKDLHNYAIAG